MSIAKPIGPTDPRTRIRSVDSVRGFALFGVLLVNMYNFGAYSTEWTGMVDRIAFMVMHSVFETKQEDVIESGQQQFGQQCAVCHGLEG